MEKDSQNINSSRNALNVTNSSCISKSGKPTENLINEIRQTIYSLYRAKEITKKVYNNIINSKKV